MFSVKKTSRWLVTLAATTIIVVVICGTIMLAILFHFKSQPATKGDALQNRSTSSRATDNGSATAKTTKKTTKKKATTKTTEAAPATTAKESTSAAPQETWASLTTTEPVATTTLPEQTTWTDEEPATTTSYEENPYEETEPSATYPDFPSDSDASYWVSSNTDTDGTINMTAALSYSNYYDMGNAYSNGYYTLSFSDSRVVIRYDDIFYERYIGGDYYCATNNGVYSMSREDIEALYRFVSGGTTNGFDRI